MKSKRRVCDKTLVLTGLGMVAVHPKPSPMILIEINEMGTQMNIVPNSKQIVETLTETLLALMVHKKQVFIDNLQSDYPVLSDREAALAQGVWAKWIGAQLADMILGESQ